jgi:hypothetical protein
MRPTLSKRLIASAAIALVAAAISAYGVHAHGGKASDFTWFYRAGAAIVAGQSPYAAIDSTGPYPYNAGFYYTMPAAMLAVPFSLGDIEVNKVLWSAMLAGVLAFGLTRDGYWRLPLLMSFPMVWASRAGQWAPLAMAAVYVPSLSCLAVGKPTLGLAVFAGFPSRRFVAWAAVAGVASLAVSLRWPVEYLREVQARTVGDYRIPIATLPFGPLLLLGATRWRRADARVLLTMSLLPQTMLFYDQLLLGVVAKTFRQALIFGLWSYLPIAIAPFLPKPTDGSTAASAGIFAQLIVATYYIPALLLVLRRPNVWNDDSLVQPEGERTVRVAAQPDSQPRR